MPDIQVTAQTNKAYPALLSKISDSPPLLYINGSLPGKDEKLFAVVGTRKPTAYGKEAAMYLTRELCRAGFSIVSGMALGIDGIAHETALLEGARTYAVLGCGVDVVYPQEHKALSERIARQGAIISEYEPGTQPLPYRFPQRNRIIAGMTLGTLVIEAKERSGALITGRLALEYNREVFAVPGSIFSATSKGPHALIKEGAKLTETINDILGEFGFEAEGLRTRLSANISAEEQRILAILEGESRHLDAIVGETGLSAAQVHGAITMLEIKDAIQHLGGNIYGLRRN
ncbi:MAG: DNA-processing protein DprA [bacterium]|nr:DNA-processing protein DprA [bacterium]